MPHDIFISYSSQDKTVADATCAALEVQKIRCWIAPRDVLAGTEWANEIVKAINNCRAMVLIFSANANRSPDIGSEVHLAFSRGIPIVSLRIENIVPEGAMEYRLSKTHWLDALTPPLGKRIDELTESVSRLLGSGNRVNNSQTSSKKNRKIVGTSTEAALLRTAKESSIEELAGESLTKLIEQGKLFKSSDCPLSRNHFEEAGYLETYPPAFDCWVLEAKSVIEKVFKANSLARSLLKEGLSTYKSFKVFKQKQDLDRIQHLLIQALKSGMKAPSGDSLQTVSPPESEAQRFTKLFAERPDVITEVESEASCASANLVAEFERHFVRLEVSLHQSRPDFPLDPEHIDRVRRLIEKRDANNEAGKALVKTSRKPDLSYEEWKERLEEYVHSIGSTTRIRDAIIALGSPALPLVCVAFRQMNSCDGHNAMRSGFCYTGWIESELLKVMSRLKDFRVLPFIADAVLRHADDMNGHNDYALDTVRALQAFGVDRNTVDQCLQRLIGVTGTEILRERRDKHAQ